MNYRLRRIIFAGFIEKYVTLSNAARAIGISKSQMSQYALGKINPGNKLIESIQKVAPELFTTPEEEYYRIDIPDSELPPNNNDRVIALQRYIAEHSNKRGNAALMAIGVSAKEAELYLQDKVGIPIEVVRRLYKVAPHLFMEHKKQQYNAIDSKRVQEQQYNEGYKATTAMFEIPATELTIPLWGVTAQAGYAEADYSQESSVLVDLKREYNANTFYIIAKGESMTAKHIHDGDWLLVDRMKPFYNGAIVVARVQGALVVKQLKKNGKQWLLNPHNPDYEPIIVDETTEIIGVVVKAEHRFT